MLLTYGTKRLQCGKPLYGDEGVGEKYQNHSVHLSAWHPRTEYDGTIRAAHPKGSIALTEYYKMGRARSIAGSFDRTQ